MDFSIENEYVKTALGEFKKDLYSKDETKLKVVLGVNLYNDPFVQEILADLVSAEKNPDVFENYEFAEFCVLEEILDSYFEAIWNHSMYQMIDTTAFQYQGKDLIDTILDEFVELEYAMEV